jgi:hypothetical protein
MTLKTTMKEILNLEKQLKAGKDVKSELDQKES